MKLFNAAPSKLDRNIWNMALEIAFFGVLFGLLQTFLSVYTIRLGASNTIVGLLTSMPPLIIALSAVPAARLVERTRSRLRFILINTTLYRLGVLALALMPFVIQQYRAEAIVVIITLITIPQALSSISFSAMFADVVPQAQRARVVAIRNTLLGLTTTLASFVGGLFLGLTPGAGHPLFDPIFTFPLNYQTLFAFGFAVSMIGVVYLGRIRGGDVASRVSAHAQQPHVRGSLMTRSQPFFSLLRQHPIFARYALAMFVFHWGVYLPIPLYSLYWVRNLHASDSFIGLLLTIQGISSMLTYPLLPRLVTRIGSRQLLGMATVLMACYPFATALATTLEPLLLVSILGGVGGAAFSLSSFNLLLELSPAEGRASFIAIFTTAANSAGFVAPFIGAALLNVISIQDDLLLGAALRFLGVFAFFAMVGIKKVSSVHVSGVT